jgi:hypothetical protein
VQDVRSDAKNTATLLLSKGWPADKLTLRTWRHREVEESKGIFRKRTTRTVNEPVDTEYTGWKLWCLEWKITEVWSSTGWGFRTDVHIWLTTAGDLLDARVRTSTWTAAYAARPSEGTARPSEGNGVESVEIASDESLSMADYVWHHVTAPSVPSSAVSDGGYFESIARPRSWGPTLPEGAGITRALADLRKAANSSGRFVARCGTDQL